jgi:DNA transformation protein and related proteins
VSGYLAYVLEQLEPVGRVRARGMFGGHGVYCDDLFFALIAHDMLHLKVDDSNRADFVARGKGPFLPFPEKPELVMQYYEVPADVVEDGEQLAVWARKAIAVALAARNAKTKTKSKPKQKAKAKAKRKPAHAPKAATRAVPAGLRNARGGSARPRRK